MSFRQIKIKQNRSIDENKYIRKHNDIMINMSYTALLYYLTVIIYENNYNKIMDHQQHSYLLKDIKFYGSLDHRKGIINSLNYLIDNNFIIY